MVQALRWIGIPFLLLVVGLLSVPPDKPRTGPHVPPMFPRYETMRALARPFLQLAADYYWVQTIQATGAAGNELQYKDIYYYADYVTQLDPTFFYAYLFAAPAMTYNRGRETWVNTTESTQLLEKGLAVFPYDIRLRILYAYNLSAYHGQYAKAAEVAEETSKLPGAPPYLKSLATRLYAQGGKVEDGLALAQSLVDSAPDPETRAEFEKRVKELELERELQAIDRAINAYKARTGKLPDPLQELVKAGDLASLPADPFGGQIVLGADGRSHSTAVEDRLEIYK
jgi:hypothetical protein